MLYLAIQPFKGCKGVHQSISQSGLGLWFRVCGVFNISRVQGQG